MTIGILACDHFDDPRLIAIHDGGDYSELYGRLMLSVDVETTVRVYDVVAGLFPDDVSDCEAWIITGSRHDAFSSEPWIEELRDFVRLLRDSRRRTVGVCFGHQVIAEALGGKVERSGSWSIGPKMLVVQPTPWFDGGNVTVNAMHRDEVRLLPEDAQLVGTGETGANPMFIVGDSMLGIQDHPEFTAEHTALLIGSRRESIGDDVADEALRRIVEEPVSNELIARWIADFLADRRRRE